MLVGAVWKVAEAILVREREGGHRRKLFPNAINQNGIELRSTSTLRGIVLVDCEGSDCDCHEGID